MPLPHTISISGDDESFQIPIELGEVIVIAGANGSGKSSLLFEIYHMLPHNLANYYPGHRQISFTHGTEGLQPNIYQLVGQMHQNHQHYNRYRSAFSEDIFKYLVRHIQYSEAHYNHSIISRIRDKDETARDDLEKLENPLAVLNGIFRTAGLPIRITTSETGLLVDRDGYKYNIDQMSDGERASLFILSATLAQSSGSALLIDEPERHLHPSISGPLIESAMRSRPDVAFIISTHDMSLVENLDCKTIVHVRNSKILSTLPERRSYSATILERDDKLPDQLRSDLLGVRSKVLFIEGDKNSPDREIYGRIYDGWKIIPKGGWEKCVESVRALRENAQFHWLEAAAIIDADGRTCSEIEGLREEQIFPIGSPTIENFLMVSEVMLSVAQTLHASEGGPTPEDRMQAARHECIKNFRDSLDDIVARSVMWQVNRAISATKISISQILGGLGKVEGIDVESIRASEKNRLTELLHSDRDPIDMISELPIKNTNIPARIATAVGAKSLKHYQAILLRQMDIRSEAGLRAFDALAARLPVLASSGQPPPHPIPTVN